MSIRCRATVVFALVILLSCETWAGFQVNTTTTGDQDAGSIDTDGFGNFTIVWRSISQVGRFRAQRYDASGAALGGETQLVPTEHGHHASVATSPDGRFVVAWQQAEPSSSYADIFVQRFDALGVPAGTASRVNTFTEGSQGIPVAAIDPAGNFVVAWYSDEQDGSSTGVFAQRFAADGTPLGDEFQVNTFTEEAQGPNGQIAVASGSDGRFIIVWRSRAQDDGDASVSGGGVYAQRYDASGAPIGGEFRVNTVTAGSQGYGGIDVDFDAAGNFVVVWNGNPDFEPYLPGGDIFGQRFDAGGGFVGPEFRVNLKRRGHQFSPSMAMDAAGNFLVVFVDQDGGGNGIFARYFAADGTPLGNDFRVNVERGGDQNGPVAASDPNGNILVAWSSECSRGRRTKCDQDQDGDESGVFARRFNTLASTCAAAPAAGCFEAGKGSIRMSAANGGSLVWKWGKGAGATVDDFGEPAQGLTSYAYCMYKDGSLVMESAIPAGGECGGNSCWRGSKSLQSFKYNDVTTGGAQADGIVRVRLKSGESGRAKASVRGQGAELDLPLPIGTFETFTVQLLNGNGTCWQSEHTGPARANTESRFSSTF